MVTSAAPSMCDGLAHFVETESSDAGCLVVWRHLRIVLSNAFETRVSDPRDNDYITSATRNEMTNEDIKPPERDLRWFAGLAMQAIMEKQASVPDSESEREEIALWSYRMAQAMVATEKRLHLDKT